MKSNNNILLERVKLNMFYDSSLTSKENESLIVEATTTTTTQYSWLGNQPDTKKTTTSAVGQDLPTAGTYKVTPSEKDEFNPNEKTLYYQRSSQKPLYVKYTEFPTRKSKYKVFTSKELFPYGVPSTDYPKEIRLSPDLESAKTPFEKETLKASWDAMKQFGDKLSPKDKRKFEFAVTKLKDYEKDFLEKEIRKKNPLYKVIQDNSSNPYNKTRTVEILLAAKENNFAKVGSTQIQVWDSGKKKWVPMDETNIDMRGTPYGFHPDEYSEYLYYKKNPKEFYKTYFMNSDSASLKEGDEVTYVDENKKTQKGVIVGEKFNYFAVKTSEGKIILVKKYDVYSTKKTDSLGIFKKPPGVSEESWYEQAVNSIDRMYYHKDFPMGIKKEEYSKFGEILNKINQDFKTERDAYEEQFKQEYVIEKYGKTINKGDTVSFTDKSGKKSYGTVTEINEGLYGKQYTIFTDEQKIIVLNQNEVTRSYNEFEILELQKKYDEFNKKFYDNRDVWLSISRKAADRAAQERDNRIIMAHVFYDYGGESSLGIYKKSKLKGFAKFWDTWGTPIELVFWLALDFFSEGYIAALTRSRQGYIMNKYADLLIRKAGSHFDKLQKLGKVESRTKLIRNMVRIGVPVGFATGISLYEKDFTEKGAIYLIFAALPVVHKIFGFANKPSAEICNSILEKISKADLTTEAGFRSFQRSLTKQEMEYVPGVLLANNQVTAEAAKVIYQKMGERFAQVTEVELLEMLGIEVPKTLKNVVKSGGKATSQVAWKSINPELRKIVTDFMRKLKRAPNLKTREGIETFMINLSDDELKFVNNLVKQVNQEKITLDLITKKFGSKMADIFKAEFAAQKFGESFLKEIPWSKKVGRFFTGVGRFKLQLAVDFGIIIAVESILEKMGIIGKDPKKEQFLKEIKEISKIYDEDPQFKAMFVASLAEYLSTKTDKTKITDEDLGAIEKIENETKNLSKKDSYNQTLETIKNLKNTGELEDVILKLYSDKNNLKISKEDLPSEKEMEDWKKNQNSKSDYDIFNTYDESEPLNKKDTTINQN